MDASQCQFEGAYFMLTFTQMRTFSSVARLNSFSRAAEELHLTQPAVSGQIVSIEETFKTKLFDRLGRGIVLTESGHLVLAACEDILERVQQLHRDMDSLGELRTGTLHIGASLVVGVYVLPEILARFKEKFPGIDLVVRVDPTRRIVDLIAQGELDLGFIAEGKAIANERLAIRPVMRDDLIVIVPPHHSLAKQKSIDLSDLALHPFVLPAKDSASGDSILDQLKSYGIELGTVLEVGNVSAVKRAVEAGLGISIISRCAVSRELRERKLKSPRLAGVKLFRPLSLCWCHSKRFSSVTTAFIQFLHEHGLAHSKQGAPCC